MEKCSSRNFKERPHPRKFKLNAVTLSVLVSLSAFSSGVSAGCNETSAGSGNYVCEGSGNTGQLITGDDISISIADDFTFADSNSDLWVVSSSYHNGGNGENGGNVHIEQAAGGQDLTTAANPAIVVLMLGSGGSMNLDLKASVNGIDIGGLSGDYTVKVDGDVFGSVSVEQVDGHPVDYGGSTNISINGNVTGVNRYGVNMLTYGTDLIVDVQKNISGFYSAVEMSNEGTGRTELYVGGDVTTQGMGMTDAIRIVNGVETTDLTILIDGNVTAPDDRDSYSNGINAKNKGSGDTTITVHGKVTGGNSLSNAQGIIVSHEGKDLTINALGGVSGGFAAIDAHNSGTGFTAITTKGDIESAGTGIKAHNDNTATDLIIHSSSDIQADYDGIRAQNEGSGETSIHSTGAISSGDHGINISHSGADLTLVSEGTITSDYASGIYINSMAQDGSHLSVTTTGDIYGESDGIYFTDSGSGNVIEVTATADVTGNTNSGIMISSGDSDAVVDIAGTVKGGNGKAINMEYVGNATLVLRNGWGLEGQAIATGNADDILRLAGLEDSTLSLAQIGDENNANAIMGFEHFEKVDNSVWTLTGAQQEGGFESANLSEGGLILDNATFLMADNASVFNMERDTTLSAKGASVIAGALISSGTIDLNMTGTPDNTLTVTGDFTSNDSTLKFGTQLGDDSSPTSQLIVQGSTYGQGQVQVDNLGGHGAKTIEGIKLIHVENSSNAEFSKSGRIVAGSYDYDLVKKGSHWYLSSIYQDPTPDPEPTPDPGPAPDPEIPTPEITPPGPEVTVPGKETHIIRPEAGSYLANYVGANTLFTTRLHDRLGETQYTDMLTGEQKVTSLWMRHVGGHNRFKDGSGQLHTQSNRYVAQIGGDLAQWSSDGLDRWHLGAMAGYAHQQSNTKASITGYRSKGSVRGYSAGLYGTWYANDLDKTGSYLDTWMLYNWFDNDVKGEGLKTESYTSRGITASIEGGYTFKLGERQADGMRYYLQPKAQVTLMNVKSNDHTEHNGTRVAFKGDGNIQSRLGLRAYMNGQASIDKGKERVFEPFIEANWIHNTKDFSLHMDDVNNNIAGAKNVGEVQIGVEGQLSRNLDLWGNVSQQIGDKGYSDTQAMLGVKYRF